MPFNLGRALQAGYAPEEILHYFASRNPPPAQGTDEERIRQVLGGKPMLPYEYANQPPPIAPPQLPYELGGPARQVGRNPRTGQPVYETQPGTGPLAILDQPMLAAPEIAGGAETFQNAQTGDQRAGGLSAMVRGGMRAAMPMLPAAAAGAPAGTLAGLLYGTLGQLGTEQYLGKRGVSPGYTALAGDIAGLVTGGAAGAAAEVAPWRSLPQLIRERTPQTQRGAIEIGEGPEWNSTLLDLIRQKAPAKVLPDQLAAIAKQAPAEEVQWSSLSDMIRKGEPLQKQQIVEHLEKNPPVKFEEKVLTDTDAIYGEYTGEGGGNYRELLLTVPQHKGRYKTGHFTDTPNVIGHMRMKDRMTPDGKKVLFLEEVQSDWHQAGRKQGYRQPTSLEDVIAARQEMNRTRDHYEALRDSELARLGIRPEGVVPTGDRSPELQAAINAMAEARDRYDVTQASSQGTNTGVPDAPFKKDWHELLMKRAFQEAADKGYDMVAWTGGEQQAERYDLRKHFTGVEYDPETSRLEAFDHNGQASVSERVDPADLDEYLGREAADKLRAQIENWAPQKSESDYHIERYDDPDGDYSYRLLDEYSSLIEDGFETRQEARDAMYEHMEDHAGNTYNETPSLGSDDLVPVGGEGMMAFYDKMLPSFANKYGKKFGAGVKQIELPDLGAPVHAMEITEPMWRSLREKGQPLFGNVEPVGSPKKQMQLFNQASGESMKAGKKK